MAFLAGAFFAGAFLAGAFFAAAFAGAALVAFAGVAFFAAALTVGGRLLGRGLGDLAGTAGDGLELGSGAERRDVALLHLDRGTRRRVARGAGRALATLEDAEAGERHLLATGDRGVDGVDDRVERVSCLLPVAVKALGQQLDELSLVGHVSSWDVCV